MTAQFYLAGLLGVLMSVVFNYSVTRSVHLALSAVTRHAAPRLPSISAQA